MTRTELHELLEIVMDAREKGFTINLLIYGDTQDIAIEYYDDVELWASDYNDFSDFIQAVKEYIQSLG